MNEEKPEPSEAEAVPDDSEWDRRTLCSDGNCIGVIGPDGRCKECGKPYEGELPEQQSLNSEAAATSPPTDKPEEKSVANEATSGQADDVPDGSTSDDNDWDRRVLCSDGNCIGVIGPDGRCTECGKPYDPSATE
ncbi:MAG: hypothetical protein PVI76_10035 [Desulfobacterales bacterium]|jgi:hypothetical protein